MPREYLVEGTTYSPEGAIKSAAGKVLTNSELQTDALLRLAEISAICNDSKIVYNEVGSHFTAVE